MSTTRKPLVRFKGFTEEWEERKFENYFNFPVSTNSLSRAMLNFNGGEVKNIHYGDILIKYPSILDVKREEIPYITDGTLEKYESNLLKNGDLIFADAAEDETVGKAVEINGISFEKIVSGLHTIVARAKVQMAEYFLGYYINSYTYHKQLLRLMQGSKVSAINKKNLEETGLFFPKDFEEQQKIGILFKQLDDTIALHQRKLEQQKKLKKAMLQKMFPKNGAKFPQIRFENFNDEWEERKFENLYRKVIEKNDLSFSENKIISVANMYFKEAENFSKSNNEYMRTYNIMREGDIAFEGNKNKNFSYGRFVENDIGDGIVSHVFDVFRPIVNYDLFFWKYYINNENVMGRILRKVTIKATMMTNLVSKDFLNSKIQIPTLKEQKQIGLFFKQLDDTIALHQRKIDQLNLMKKSMLQKMFV